MSTKIKLTKLSEHETSSSSSLDVNCSVEGTVPDNSVFPKVPTPGRPFVMDTYRTSLVKQTFEDNTFKTRNAVYKWEVIA